MCVGGAYVQDKNTSARLSLKMQGGGGEGVFAGQYGGYLQHAERVWILTKT